MFGYGATTASPAFYDSDEMSELLRQILLRTSNQRNSPVPPITHVETDSTPQLQPIAEAEEEDYDYPTVVGAREGLEALVEEASKRRRSSKRRRAAEVHNMSEKRRRSRINEKMKALQELIPNSNKTDKASMLDEAIEYLKQLQLQVQTLTMRNGLALHPMCLLKSAHMYKTSPDAVKLESSSPGHFFALNRHSDVFFSSAQMNPQ